MPSYGIVPALSSLRGAVGYFEHGLFGDGQAQQQDNAGNQEERQSLLQVSQYTSLLLEHINACRCVTGSGYRP
jgi:hypothetical protein